MGGTFISYRREDAAGYAGRLRESLERRIGAAGVFRDVDALQPGQDFVQAIESRLASCRVMLVVIGREWLEAKSAAGTRRLDDPYDFVRLEVAAGLARPDVLVIPALVEGVQMPVAADLPADIRPLARRHAVSLRDETWDADVDRLVEVVHSAGAGSTSRLTRTSTSILATWTLAALAVIVLIALGAMWSRARTGTEPPPAGRTGGSSSSSGATPAEPALAPYAIDVPRIAEMAFGDLIYTLVSGSVVSRDTSRQLRLRMRMSNGGAYNANLWDRSFRLVTGGDARAPTSDLNELTPGHSLRYGIVTFDLPAGARTLVLRVTERDMNADLPLDVSPTGRAAADEQVDEADSLSQAIVRTAPDKPEPLVTTTDVGVALDRVTSRRFVNVVRLTLTARIENRGRYPLSPGDLVFRITAGDAVLAPIASPGDPINARSTSAATIVFDLPPTATRAVLKVTYREQSTERPVDVP